MNGLYVERVLAMRPDRAAFQRVKGDELELNKLLVKELTPLLKQTQFNPNHDIDKVDLLQLAYGICLQVHNNPLENDADEKIVEWLTINDFLKTISIYSTSSEQSSMALCMAMHILSLQREITPQARKFADLMKAYCSQTALDSRLYKYFCSLRTEKSKQYKVDWASFNPDIDNLSALSHSTWNTITHGFSLEMVESWLGQIESKRYQLLKVITEAFEEDVRQRKITEEQNDNFDW